MRRNFYLIFLFLFSLSITESKEPNIVYIMSDELAYFELSHMGNPYIKTPRIDQMVEEGIRFSNAYAGSPVCAPLRCNLMTGKHAKSFGFFNSISRFSNLRERLLNSNS